MPASFFGLFEQGPRRRQGIQSRKPRARPRPFPVEQLEPRVLLSATPANPLDDVVSLSWRGRQIQAIANEWIVEMPQSNAATAMHAADYESTRPRVPRRWSVEDLGLGFYKVTTPGVSQQIVSRWAQRLRAVSLSPNTVYHKQALVPNDPSFDELWALDNTGQVGGFDDGTQTTGPGTLDADIDATEAWETYTTGSSEVIVAVLDDGLDYSHVDLQANMWTRPANVPANRYGLFGWDSADNDDNVRSADLLDDHGTHVAGTIGAVGDNGIGVTGVAWDVKLYGAKVFRDGSTVRNEGATFAWLVDAVSRIVDLKMLYGQNIVAINASLGGPGYDDGFAAVISRANAAGIMLVASAGNGGFDGVGDNNDVQPQYPAGYQLPNVVSVAASNRADALTRFSNWGNSVAIAAPGSEILSTEPGSAYGYKSGTSMAAPQVTGAVALMAAYALEKTGENATVNELKTALYEGADNVDTLFYTETAANGDPTPGRIHTIDQNRRLNALGSLDSLDVLLTPEVTVRAARPSGREGSGLDTTIEFTVGLTRRLLSETVEVTYSTEDIAAVAGEDYESNTGTLTFAPGEQFKTVTVTVYGDRDLEEDEAFGFVASSTVNAKLGLQSSTIYTIRNDESPLVIVSPTVVFEGTGQRSAAVFDVSISGNVLAPVMVSYGTRDGTAVARRDYVPTQGMLVFRPGETSRQVSVSIVGDRAPEEDEFFQLVVSGVRNGTLADGSEAAAGYIVDDDSRQVSVTSLTPSVVGGQDASFRVALERMAGFGEVFPEPPEGVDVPPLEVRATLGTVNRSALGGRDFQPGTLSVVFAPDALEFTQTVPTFAVERNREFLVRLASVEGAEIGTRSASATILSAFGAIGGDPAAATPSSGVDLGGWSRPWWRRFGRR
jgi:subtilisin family serine protease